MKDGWHIAAGYEVYVEDGKILRGVLGKGNSRRTAYPYRSGENCWTECIGITVDAFRAGARRGTVKLR